MRLRAPFSPQGGFARPPGPPPRPPQPLPGRARGPGLAGAAAVIGFGQGAAASGAANLMPVMDPDLRDAALRGLALAGYRGDPVTAAAANAALDRLAETDPEGGFLGG